MHTRAPHSAFQLLRELNCLTHQWILVIALLSKLRESLQAILNRHLHLLTRLLIRHIVRSARNKRRKSVALRNGQILHSSHIFYSHLGRHCAISDNMRHFFRAIFLCHILQHFRTAVIIKVHIDIRQRNSVWIKESLKQ